MTYAPDAFIGYRGGGQATAVQRQLQLGHHRSSANHRTLENLRGKFGFTISRAQSFPDAKGEPR